MIADVKCIRKHFNEGTVYKHPLAVSSHIFPRVTYA